MTDEERQRTMDFILQQQARTSAALEASMARLAEAQARADERVSALIDIILDSRNGPS